jgi:hypothetical protein
MKWSVLAAVLAVLTLLVAWLQREHTRGTFDPVEREFVSWLAANVAGGPPLPPLTVVLFDEESSELAGNGRLALLDGALFTRAASRLGATAAGVEGIAGDPLRMIDAAEGMPVFGGYDWQTPPGKGWTPLRGEPGAAWPEVPGLTGTGGRFARGFVTSPEGASGAQRILLAGRNGGRAVPSFLALAWAVAQGSRWSEVIVAPGVITARNGKLNVAADGAAQFLPESSPSVLTMNELLVASEKFEREGGVSPFHDHILVLARATADVARVAVGEAGAVTPVERWAAAWEAVRTNRLFLLPGWWYPVALVLAGAALTLGPARRSSSAALLAGFFALLLFALAALGAFGTARVLLPAGPALLTLVASLMFGRAGHRAGWFGK